MGHAIAFSSNGIVITDERTEDRGPSSRIDLANRNSLYL